MFRLINKEGIPCSTLNGVLISSSLGLHELGYQDLYKCFTFNSSDSPSMLLP